MSDLPTLQRHAELRWIAKESNGAFATEISDRLCESLPNYKINPSGLRWKVISLTRLFLLCQFTGAK